MDSTLKDDIDLVSFSSPVISPLIPAILFHYKCFSLQVAQYNDPRDACAAIAGESYKLWLEHENRTDDITIIIVHIKNSSSVSA